MHICFVCLNIATIVSNNKRVIFKIKALLSESVLRSSQSFRNVINAMGRAITKTWDHTRPNSVSLRISLAARRDTPYVKVELLSVAIPDAKLGPSTINIAKAEPIKNNPFFVNLLCKGLKTKKGTKSSVAVVMILWFYYQFELIVWDYAPLVDIIIKSPILLLFSNFYTV